MIPNCSNLGTTDVIQWQRELKAFLSPEKSKETSQKRWPGCVMKDEWILSIEVRNLNPTNAINKSHTNINRKRHIWQEIILFRKTVPMVVKNSILVLIYTQITIPPQTDNLWSCISFVWSIPQRTMRNKTEKQISVVWLNAKASLKQTRQGKF